MKPNNKITQALRIALALLALSLLALLLASDADANLYVVVTPGYQFPTSPPYTAITWAELNALGTPSMAIYGTVGGSNTLAPGTVTGVSMVDNFPDGGELALPIGATLGWNTASPRQMAVNTAGIIDGLGGLRSGDTNALAIFADPTWFELATNSGGNDATNYYPASNTGSPGTNWLTLRHNSLGDFNIATGGLSSVSIIASGLLPQTANTEQIYTNVFALSGSTYTNTSTNFLTVWVGASNGVGQVVNLGPGLSVSNVPTITSLATNAGTYYSTSAVPTLVFAGFNGSLPLTVNDSPWTNAIPLTNLTGTAYNYTSLVLNAHAFGGAVPYSNNWSVLVASNIGAGVLNSYRLSSTNGNQTQLIVNANSSGGAASIFVFDIFLSVTDATAQLATPDRPIVITMQQP